MARADIRRDVELARELGGGLSAFERLPDEDRGLLRADWLIRHRTCKEHGGDIAECSHEVWYPQRSVCLPAMELAAAEARYDEIHEELAYHDGTFRRWSKTRDKEFPYHYRDGVRLWISKADENPGDKFLTKPRHWQMEAQLLAAADADAQSDDADED